MKITVQNISKSYDGKPILKDISLILESPGIYALVGPNGSGKTTLMRILAGLEKTDSGAVRCEKLGSEGYEDGIRRRMTLIHNPAVMFSGSVGYNISFGLKVRGVSGKAVRRQVKPALEHLSLVGFEKREAKTLSAGEIQRVALARALVIDPEIVFLDEPTANLDPLSAKLIEKTILDLASRGKKVILATHNLWQVERIADWVWFLNDGMISISGTVQDVLHKGDQAFWGKFLGRDNLFNGEVIATEKGKSFKVGKVYFEVATEIAGPAMASLNPSEIILSTRKLASSARNVLEGMITEAISEGGLYKVSVNCGLPLTAAITKASWDEMNLKVGNKVYAVFKASSVRVWKENSS